MDEEERNYCCLALLLLRVGNPCLRRYFKTQWDAAGTFSPWTDCEQNGTDLLQIFEPLPYERKKVKSGDTSQWDISLLVKALLRSQPPFVVATYLVAALKTFKKKRDDLCHSPNPRVKATDFQTSWRDVCNALSLFGATVEDFDKVEQDVQKPWSELLLMLKHCAVQDQAILDTLDSFNSKLEQLLQGQHNIAEGQAKLLQGQDNIAEGLAKLLQGQDNIAEGQDKLLQGQKNSAEGQDKLLQGQKNSAEGQTKLLQGQKNSAEGQAKLLQGQDTILKDLSSIKKDQRKIIECHTTVDQQGQKRSSADVQTALGKPIVTRPKKESVNFVRLCRLLIDGGTQVLRDVFDSIHPPSSLQSTLLSTTVYSTLKRLRAKRILTNQQWDRLYTASRSTAVTSADFDITLLFVLLRNICGLTPPPTGWDKLPVATDPSREADLVRVKYYRNELFSYIKETAVSDSDFEKYWSEISDVLVRLGGSHYKSFVESTKVERMDIDFTTDVDEIAGKHEVPPEILARGPKAEEAYKHALKEGKVQVYRGRIMIIGQHGVGKTSLKKSLLGLPFNPEEPSTVGVDVDPSSFSFDVDRVIEWKKLEDDSNNSFDDSVARIMADRLSKSEEKPNTPNELPMLENRMSRTSVNLGFDDVNDVNKFLPRTKTENRPSKDVIEAGTKMEYRPPENVIESLIKYLSEKFDDKEFSSEDKVQVSVWDFAGQQLYYASHPVFFSPRAVYVLVFNLSKNLNEDVEPCPRQGVYDTNLNNHEKQTNLESILSWLASVHTTRPEENGKSKDGKDLPYVRPPVIIVGTHADCPFAAPQEMEAMIQKSLDGKTYNEHVVRAFIAVDNKSEDKKGVQEVRDEVHRLFKTEPYIGEYVPVRWLMFEKVIKTLVDEKGINHLPLKDLEKVIFEVCHTEDKDEIAAMLNFYHDLGVIVKYGKSVVLNAEWLIDLFKRLITINRYNELNPRYRSYWTNLENTGILDMELAEHVFDDAIISKHSDIRDDILAIMERYALIAKFGTAESFQYFVPAQLQSSPGDLIDAEPKESDPCALYLQFKDGFVPHGLYYCIVSKMIAWCSEKKYLKEPKLFRNVTQFAIGCSYEYELLLICRKPFIKVVLRSLQGERSPNFKPAFSVRTWLVDCLETVKNDCLGYRSISYDITVLCPSCSKGETKCKKHKFLRCREDSCLHLLPFTNDEGLFCKEAFKNVQVPGLDEWYRDPSTNLVFRSESLAISNKQDEAIIDVTQEGGRFDISLNGALLEFPPNAVESSTQVVCKVCSGKSIPSPEADPMETLVSHIVQLGPSSVELQQPVIVTMLHAGPGKKSGYEMIVKAFNDEERIWKEIEEFKDTSHIPQNYKPGNVIQVKISKLTSLAVISRLVTDTFEVTPTGCVVTSSVCNSVKVTFPEGAVDKTITGSMKVVLLPEMIFLFSGFKDIEFLKPVTIEFPHGGSTDDFPGHLRVMSQKGAVHPGESWNEVKGNVKLEKKEEGFLELHVQHFCRLTVAEPIPGWWRSPQQVFLGAFKENNDSPKLTIACASLFVDFENELIGLGYERLAVSTAAEMRSEEKAYVQLEDGGDIQTEKNVYVKFIEGGKCREELVYSINKEYSQIHGSSFFLYLCFYPTTEYIEDKRIGRLAIDRRRLYPTVEKPQMDENQNSFVVPTRWKEIPYRYWPNSVVSVDHVYKMTSSPRGIAYIININKFSINCFQKLFGALDERFGSKSDVDSLENLFTGLHFKVDSSWNLNKRELLSQLQMISKTDFSWYDCLVVFIMSHGEENHIYAADGKKVSLKKIFKMFKNSNCTSLQRKPKLFFIQACRGTTADPGVVYSDHSGAENEEKEKACCDGLNDKKHPEYCDNLYGYSCYEGHVSYRSKDQGTYYVQSLVDIFREHSCQEDLLSLLTKVNNRVSELEGNQIPQPSNTLRKLLYFWP